MAPKAVWLGAALISVVGVSTAAVAPRVTDHPAHQALLTTPPDIKAVVPTSSGQIGINPVSSELGNPESYQVTDVGPDSQIVTFDGSTYRYIEDHTRYLSEEIVTITTNGIETTTVSFVAAAIATATSNTPDLAAGDITLTFAESVADALRKTADETIAACSLKKRDLAVQCMINAAVQASGGDGPLNGVMTDAFWDELGPLLAANAPEYLYTALAALAQAQKNKALIILGAIMLGLTTAGVIAVIKIPQAGVGSPTNDDIEPKCDPNADADKDSPLCSDSDCQGDSDNLKCTTGDNKGCACLLLGTDAPAQVADQSWWDNQQQVFASFAANPNLLGTAAPSCFVNTDGDAFDGKPAASPASWCVCNIGGTTRIYPTMTSASSPCALSAVPTATISPAVTANGAGPVTSCRTATITGTMGSAEPYCTCNDNSMYPLASWTEGSSTVTGCTATRTVSMTTSATPIPTCNTPKQFTINQDALLSAGDKFCSDNSGQSLLPVPINPYSNAVTEYIKDGASGGGQIYVFAYLDKGCTRSLQLNQNDCKAAFQSIYDKCDVGQSSRQGGAASINCQWFNITAVDQCMGSTSSFTNPGSCNVGNLPSYYSGWPLGIVAS